MGWIDEVYEITSGQVDEMAKTAVIIVAIVMYSGQYSVSTVFLPEEP